MEHCSGYRTNYAAKQTEKRNTNDLSSSFAHYQRVRRTLPTLFWDGAGDDGSVLFGKNAGMKALSPSG
jgi:hypothetical protein